MATQQALALWKSQIPSYQKIIQRCCNRIQTPLTVFLPPDFQQKIQQFKQSLCIKQPDNYENFLDIIVYYIEGRKNKSIIQLADQFVGELGGALKYWQNVILDVSEQTVYTSHLSLWHVRKIFEEKLYVDAENLSNYRRLCRLTKAYLTTLNNLIKYIMKFDAKKDNLTKIDDLFKKVKSAEQKYVGFSEQITGLQSSNTFNELSNNISQKSKLNALKNLYHFREPQKPSQNQKTRNTLFNYNFKMKNKQINYRASGPTKNLKETNKQLAGEKMQIFEKIIKNLKNHKQDVKQLQNQFRSQKKQIKVAGFPTNFVSIWDKDYYFSFLHHPIETSKFKSYTEPFQKHDWVNYQINSDDEYQDLIGEDVQAITQISEASELSGNSFVVSDDHFSDDENIEKEKKQIKPQISNCFGDRWYFHRKDQDNKIKFYEMITVESKTKFPFQMNEKTQIQQALFRIVDGKDKESIMQAISKQKIKITKAKIKQFLSKKCKSYVEQNSKKLIYKIIEIEEENKQVSEKENISRKSYRECLADSESEQKDQEQETDFYEPSCLSQPPPEGQRRLTRQSKKQSSERIPNSRAFDNQEKQNSRQRKSGSNKRRKENKNSV